MREEPIVNTTSEGGMPNLTEISLTVGCTPFMAAYSSIKALMLLAAAFKERLTFMEPSSRMKRFISPAIMGTA